MKITNKKGKMHMKKIISLLMVMIMIMLSSVTAFAYTEASDQYSLDFNFIKEGAGYTLKGTSLSLSQGGYVVFSDELLFQAQSVTAVAEKLGGKITVVCEEQSVELDFSSATTQTGKFGYGVHKQTKDITVYALSDVTLLDIKFNRYPTGIASDRKIALPDISQEEYNILSAFIVKVNGNAYLSNGATRWIDYENPHVTAKMINGKMYVPAQAIATGLHLYWESIPEKSYFLMRDANEEEILISSDVCYFADSNDKRTIVENPAIIENGVMYLPLRQICEFLGENVTYKDGIAVVDTYKNANYILNDSNTWSFVTDKLNIFNPNYSGRTYHVAQNSPNASDYNSGTEDQPFKTIAAASAIVGKGDTILIHEGTYRETVRPNVSGSASAPITYKAAPGEKVVVSALEPLNSFASYPMNGQKDMAVSIMKSSLAQGRNLLFYKGEALAEGRHPNTDDAHPEVPEALNLSPMWATQGSILTTGVSNTMYSPNGLLDQEEPDYWKGATFVRLGSAGWALSMATVKSSEKGKLIVTGGTKKWWFGKSKDIIDKSYGYLTGHINTVDMPGEWYIDAEENLLYVIPPEGETIESLKLEYKARQLVFDLKERSYIIIEGIDTIGGGTTTLDGSMNVINKCNMKYISHYTWSDDQRDGFIEDNTKRDKNGAPPRGEVGVYLDGENQVIANTTIDHSAAAGIFSTGTYALIENNVLLDCGYMGSYVGGIHMEAPGWKGSDKDYKHGGEHIYKNTIRRAGRGAVNVANVGDTGGDYVSVMPYDICYNDISDGLLGGHDGGVVYLHGVFVGTDIQRAKLHHNAVSNQWQRTGSPRSAIYYDNFVTYGENYDNIIYRNGLYGYSSSLYIQNPQTFPTSYATIDSWGGISYESKGKLQLSDIPYSEYPGGRPFQFGSSIEKGVFMENYNNRHNHNGWYNAQGELSETDYVLFENVDFGEKSNALSVYYSGNKFNTGDVIEFYIGETIETAKKARTTVYTNTTELDYLYFTNLTVGETSGVHNVWVKATDLKSLNIHKIHPYYEEGLVFVVEKFYGAVADELVMGDPKQPPLYQMSTADPVQPFMNNTWPGTILKYFDVELTADSNSFVWNAASGGKWAGNTVDVYLNSLESEPVASFVIPNTGWTGYKDHLIELDKIVPKGTYDVFIKFGGKEKSSNYYSFSFINTDEKTLSEQEVNPDGTKKE